MDDPENEPWLAGVKRHKARGEGLHALAKEVDVLNQAQVGGRIFKTSTGNVGGTLVVDDIADSLLGFALVHKSLCVNSVTWMRGPWESVDRRIGRCHCR